MLLQLGIIYIPWLHNVFETDYLGLEHWLIIIACSVVPVILINIINEIIYKRRSSQISY